MMAKCIVYTRPDGTVSILHPAPEFVARFDTEEIAVRVLMTEQVPVTATNVLICDRAVIPASRRFRDAWRQVGTDVPSIDMPLARLQRMAEVRTARRAKLEKSDKDVVRVLEATDAGLQNRLRIYRQTLRDLPATLQPIVDAITTPEALEAWEPAWPADPVP